MAHRSCLQSTTESLPTQRLFLYVIRFINAHLVRQIEFLKVEKEMLRSRLGKQVHTRPEERRRLLKFGQPLGESIKDLISIVSYQRFRRWLGRATGPAEHRHGKGRPRTTEEIEQLVLRMARENDCGFGGTGILPVISSCIGWKPVPPEIVGSWPN